MLIKMEKKIISVLVNELFAKKVVRNKWAIRKQAGVVNNTV